MTKAWNGVKKEKELVTCEGNIYFLSRDKVKGISYNPQVEYLDLVTFVLGIGKSLILVL